MKEDLFRSQFRLPYPLYERLQAAAEQANRSLNAEIVARLVASFSAEDPVTRLLAVLDERDQRLLEEMRAALREALPVRGNG